MENSERQSKGLQRVEDQLNETGYQLIHKYWDAHVFFSPLTIPGGAGCGRLASLMTGRIRPQAGSGVHQLVWVNTLLDLFNAVCRNNAYFANVNYMQKVSKR